MPDHDPTFDAIQASISRTAPPEAEGQHEPERRLLSGWWLFPATVCGGAIYGLLMWAIFA